MRVTTSLLFVTHLPSFYKVNLYNEIAKSCAIFVIFIAQGSQIRHRDFTQNACHFEYVILSEQSVEKRSRVLNCYALWQLLRKIHYQKLIVGGWDLIEFWWLVLLSPKQQNGLALESTIFESQSTGLRGWLKNLFLKRISLVFPSGLPHQALLKALRYSGEVKKTLGVGLFNYLPRQVSVRTFSGKFLYVGRFAAEKNLRSLVQYFNATPQYSLTLIGAGPLKSALQAIARPNIVFKDHVPNEQLAKWYGCHDVFILPSLAEPWGLVVEEALYFGLPVLVSNRVGCAKDLVQGLSTGVLFDPTSRASFHEALLSMIKEYPRFAARVKSLDFKTRDSHQIEQYLKALQ